MKSYPIAMAGRGALAALAALELGRDPTPRGETIVTIDRPSDRVAVINEAVTYTIEDQGMRVYPPAFWDNRPMFKVEPRLRGGPKWRGYQPSATPNPEKDKRKRKAASRARAITKRNRK